MTRINKLGQCLLRQLFKRREYHRVIKIELALVGFLIGLWLAGMDYEVSATLIVVGLVFSPAVWSRTALALVAAFWLGASLGLVRGNDVMVQTRVYDNYFDEKVSIAGTVADDSTYNRFGQREFTVTEVSIAGNELPGRVEVSGFGVNSVQRGDTIIAEGKLKPGYGSDNAQISFATITVTKRSDSPISRIRKQFFAGTYTAIGEPEASLGLGFLVGGRTLLPDDLLNALSITGLTHIVAVSGYNLTILVRLMRRSLAKVSKYWATAGSFGLILSFISVTGLSPSISRAGVVTSLALIAWYFGRQLSPIMLLLVSGAITAGITPAFIWQDLGWWLSFLAFIGVLIVAPLVTRRLYGNKKPGTLAQIVIETSCAQLMTMPLIGAIFGDFSIIAILANAVVLPLIPLAMLCTFLAGLAGWFVPSAVGWFAWPARLVLELITSLVTILSNIPRALLAVELSIVGMIAIYAVIGVIVGVLAIKLKRRGDLHLDGAKVVE